MADMAIAVVRCTWEDFPQNPRDWMDAQFHELFLPPGHPLGVARYWSDCSFGLIGFSGSKVFEWEQMPYKLPDQPDRLDLIWEAYFQARAPFFTHDYQGVVAFMDPWPSNAGAKQWRTLNGCVLDWNSTASHMLHEVGHVLGFEHSCDATGNDYGDPYCIMSAHTYGGENPTFHPSDGEIDHLNVPQKYWWEAGPMPAAATLYTFTEFAGSASVRTAHPDTDVHSFRLKALSEGELGDPLLLVSRIKDSRFANQDWIGDKEGTVEYREASGWDRAVIPAGVIHTVEHTTHTNHPIRPCYQGRIPIPLTRGVTDWQSTSDDFRITVVNFIPEEHVVEVQISRRVDPGVSIAREMYVESSPRDHALDIPQRDTFPIADGLCGEGEFEYVTSLQQQRLELVASVHGGIPDPKYDWDINGEGVAAGNTPRFFCIADAYAENGRPQVPQRQSIELKCVLKDNRLTIWNLPKYGTCLLSIGVAVTDKATATVVFGGVSESFQGIVFRSREKERADRECRDRFKRRPGGLGDHDGRRSLPVLDHGDPVWRVINQLDVLTPSDRMRIASDIAAARQIAADDPATAERMAGELAKRLNVEPIAILG